MPNDDLTLSSLAGGALEMRFQEELAKLLANIDDPNTPAERKRELNIRLAFAPSKSRREIGVTMSVVPKLAQHEPLETNTWLAFDASTGAYVAKEHNPNQARIEFEKAQTEARPKEN